MFVTICDLMLFLKCVTLHYYKKRPIWNGIIFITSVESTRKDNHKSHFATTFVQ